MKEVIRKRYFVAAMLVGALCVLLGTVAVSAETGEGDCGVREDCCDTNNNQGGHCFATGSSRYCETALPWPFNYFQDCISCTDGSQITNQCGADDDDDGGFLPY